MSWKKWTLKNAFRWFPYFSSPFFWIFFLSKESQQDGTSVAWAFLFFFIWARLAENPEMGSINMSGTPCFSRAERSTFAPSARPLPLITEPWDLFLQLQSEVIADSHFKSKLATFKSLRAQDIAGGYACCPNFFSQKKKCNKTSLHSVFLTSTLV